MTTTRKSKPRNRVRDYLTKDEMARLLRAARATPRYGVRNHCMILLAWRHGFRASELCDLRISDIDFTRDTILCRRKKNSNASLHELRADEAKALMRVLQERPDDAGPLVFWSERGEKHTRQSFWRIVSEAGKAAGLGFPVYSHMLRHACGFHLANKGRDLRIIQDYLGHKYVQNTVRYTRVNAGRFSGPW